MVKVANYLAHDTMTDEQVVPKHKRTIAWIKANWREPLAGTVEDVDATLIDRDGYYRPSATNDADTKLKKQ